MPLYSPFVDKSGRHLPIDKINKSHLLQLKDSEEGYKLELKRRFDDKVKKKIPAIFASFANSGGGWLIIGVDNDTKELTPIPKINGGYSPILYQLVKTKVSPFPTYNAKFIKTSERSGVLVVYIYEGTFTPYVSNGTVYGRSGDSKEPVKALQTVIESLFKKAVFFHNRIMDFCKREVSFPFNSEQYPGANCPIVNIYFKKISAADEGQSLTHVSLDEIKERITGAKNSVFKYAKHQIESVLFQNSVTELASNKSTIFFQLFHDYSAKFHIPLSFSSENARGSAIKELIKLKLLSSAENINIVDGFLGYINIIYAIHEYMNILKKDRVNLKDLAMCFEIEHPANLILFFAGKKYLNFVKENGAISRPFISARTKIFFLKDLETTYEDLPFIIAYDYFLQSYGFSPNIPSAILYEAQRQSHQIK